MMTVAVLALITAPALCAAPDLDSLLASLARPAPASTLFVEIRYSKLLDAPLVARGQLEYLGPNELARTITEPFHERTQISGETVSVTREGQKPRRFSLRRAPELRSMLAGFEAVLGGGRTVLERDFKVEVQGESERWALKLTPRASQMARYVRGIVIQGANTEPRCIEVTEPDDDTSIMLIGTAAQTLLPIPPDRTWLSRYCETPGV
jgi:hypothetical protein